MSAVSRACSNSGAVARDAKSSAFFSIGILRIDSSRKCSAFAICAIATSFAVSSPKRQNATRMRRRRSGSARSLMILRAFHMGAGSYNGGWGVGCGEWESVTEELRFSSHTPLPTPHSQHLHLVRGQHARLPRGKIADANRSDGDADERDHLGIERFNHPPHLPV